jgi:hypothetical protein
MIEGKAEFCKEKLKIENNFCKSKYISETLRKDFKEKVQRVFKEIYTFYYNKGNHKTIESIEKEISMLKTCINERFRINRSEYLHIFAKLLRDNISFYINSFKDKITEENVHKKLKKKYTDLKNSIHYDLNVEMKENLNSKQKQEKYSKCLTEIMNFCKDNTSGILSIINDLNKTYLFLLKACSHLILIFEFPLNEMNKEFKTSINLENLHKEEFFNVIINDDFIKSLIIEVKNKELPLFLNLRPVIVKIEGDIANSTKDMKNLKLLILDLDKEEKEPDDLKDHDLSSLTDPRSLNQLIINTSKYFSIYIGITID